MTFSVCFVVYILCTCLIFSVDALQPEPMSDFSVITQSVWYSDLFIEGISKMFVE